MPRQKRRKSDSGIYHVMLRGINQQQIFEDSEDNIKYLSILRDYKAVSDFKIFAYCLMGNHVHLLRKTGNESLDRIFKKIGTKYVYWYNIKYKRTGHLFQDRYKNEPIENDNYLLMVLRYIHQNPLMAYLSHSIEKYQWSSYNEYVENGGDSLIDSTMVFEIMSKEQFILFNREFSDEKYLDMEANDRAYRITDEEAYKIIKEISECKSAAEFEKLEIKKRNEYIRKIKEKGISIRQLNRLTE